MNTSGPNQDPSFTVTQHAKIHVDAESYSWLPPGSTEVPAVAVALADGTAFVYASAVGLSKSIAKIADTVPSADSASLQTTLFNSLPNVLTGKPHPGISRVEKSRHIGSTLFVASRNLAKQPCLIFAVEPQAEENALHTVLRLGVCPPRNVGRVLGLMGINVIRNSRRS